MNYKLKKILIGTITMSFISLLSGCLSGRSGIEIINLTNKQTKFLPSGLFSNYSSFICSIDEKDKVFQLIKRCNDRLELSKISFAGKMLSQKKNTFTI